MYSLTELKLAVMFSYYDAIEWIVYRLFSKKMIYLISYQTLNLIAPSVPIMAVLGEMRKRGLVEYYCTLYMIDFCVSDGDDTSKVNIGEILERFKKEI